MLPLTQTLCRGGSFSHINKTLALFFYLTPKFDRAIGAIEDREGLRPHDQRIRGQRISGQG